MTTKDELLMLKGIISDMSAADQENIKVCASELRSIVSCFGEFGTIALALVGLEKASE